MSLDRLAGARRKRALEVRFYSTCDGKLRSNGIGFAFVYLLMYFFWPSDAHSVDSSCFMILSPLVHAWSFLCIIYIHMHVFWCSKDP